MNLCSCGREMPFHRGDPVCWPCRNRSIREERKAEAKAAKRKPKKEKPVKTPRPPKPIKEPAPTFTTLAQFLERVGSDSGKAPCLKSEMQVARDLCQLAWRVTGDEDPSGILKLAKMAAEDVNEILARPLVAATHAMRCYAERNKLLAREPESE